MDDEDDYEEPTSGGGGMVEHIQKYKSYIQGLKQGGSSGISAAFGRASELLPSDVLEVAPPKATVSVAVGPELDERVFVEEYDRAALRSAVEDLIVGCAQHLDDFIGVSVMTSEGESEVVNCFVEDGQRKFMLANLDVIDEAEFNRTRQGAGEQSNDDDLDDAAPDDRADAGRDERSERDDADVQYGRQDQDDDVVQDKSDAQAADVRVGVNDGFDARDFDDLVDAVVEQSIAETFESVNFGEERPFDLVVHNAAGNLLWGIHYDGLEIDQVVMADGTQIRRAEGRHEYVMVQRANDRLHPRIYILSGVMVDPITGNVYAEANKGGYTAAFLNNGWQIHQYRSRDSKDSFFVKEPNRSGRRGAFFEVINLALDARTGEVSYETIDSSATVTLKSRILFPGE